MCNIHISNNFVYMVATKQIVFGDTNYYKYLASCVFHQKTLCVQRVEMIVNGNVC